MTSIELTDGYFVEIKGANYTLKRRTVTKPTIKDGQLVKGPRVAVKRVSYCKTLGQAVEAYLRSIQNGAGDRYYNSLKEYAEMVEKSNLEAVRAICGGVEEFDE